ncbi:Glycerol-3-phosphate acyltransferase 4 [Eumeta japonica]|uniref:Glycerol-3-phosphate acyltransferase 4 n=1 Tax=Eumeta variegata TaxID=151549 RepID=A0A4C1XL03_EUMVA|nr:Glycerol-3-phosphate acyltransferase 4 [Eumeta japonica]
MRLRHGNTLTVFWRFGRVEVPNEKKSGLGARSFFFRRQSCHNLGQSGCPGKLAPPRTCSFVSSCDCVRCRHIVTSYAGACIAGDFIGRATELRKCRRVQAVTRFYTCICVHVLTSPRFLMNSVKCNGLTLVRDTFIMPPVCLCRSYRYPGLQGREAIHASICKRAPSITEALHTQAHPERVFAPTESVITKPCLLLVQHIEVANRLKRHDSSDEEDAPAPPSDRPPSALVKGNGLNGVSKMTVIEREEILGPSPELNYKRSSSQERLQNGQAKIGSNSTGESNHNLAEFHLSHCLDLIKAGMEAIIEDQVTSRFEAEELRSWNLLTRTNRQYEFLTWRLTIIWVMGFVVRYFFLLPLRLLIFVIGVWWLIVCTACVGCVPDGAFKQKLNYTASILCFNFLSRSLSAVIQYHNPENKPKSGICVANHTSPIDVLVLMCDNCYSLIGQRHDGFLGLLQRALARASPHIWFERSEVKDRNAVARRLKEHISEPNNPPILIFPEGTCINNTSVMQFKKGSFEVGGTVYPVAIKYDPRFGDAFWNSSRQTMLQYLALMMSSWAVVCDVWYLPPMKREPNESAVEFANRVKAVIARRGGLVDLMWDGQLKRMKPKKEWRELQQEEFSRRLKGE